MVCFGTHIRLHRHITDLLLNSKQSNGIHILQTDEQDLLLHSESCHEEVVDTFCDNKRKQG